MALVDSLLTAMVRADGDALVMHVGERPIVVSGARTIDLSNHGMNLGAMVGMLGQLLSNDAQATLKEFGAVEHELPSRDPDRFSVVAARSGDDIWIEIRRRREHETAALAAPAMPAPPAPEPEAGNGSAPADANAAVASESEVVAETANAGSAAEVDAPEDVPSSLAEAEIAAAAPSATEPVTEEAALVSDEAASAQVQSTSPELIESTPSAAPSGQLETIGPSESETHVPVTPVALPAPNDVPEVELAPADEHVAALTRSDEHEAGPTRVDEEAVAPTSEVGAAPAAQDDELAPPEPEMVQASAAHAPYSEPYEAHTDQSSQEPAAVEDLEPDAIAEDVPREEAAPVTALEPAVMADAAVEAAAAGADSAAQAVLASAATVSHPVSALASGTSMDAARHQGQSAGGPPPESVVAGGQPPDHAVPGATAGGADSVASAPVTRTVRIEVPPRAASSRAAGIDRLLRAADAVGASELFVVSQARPYVRVGGNVRPLQDESLLLGSDIEALIADVTPEPWRDAVRRGDPAEWLIELAEIGRVRCATFRDHRGPGANFHFAFLRAATADELQLSAEIRLLATEPDGLVLVSGAAGSDMSAIVAAFVDLLNQQRADYIITLEPQVRVLHMNRQALVSQREVGLDPARALAAARAALREQPDVLVIESLACGQLAQLAVESSQDRLVIASIDAVSAPAAVQRLLELVAAEHRQHAREQLSRCFRGAVAQLLLRKATGGRVAARELLTGTRAVARLLLDGDLSRLSDQLEAGGAAGLAPLTDTLVDYVRSGTVDVREAVRKAPDADRLVARLKSTGADLTALERWN